MYRGVQWGSACHATARLSSAGLPLPPWSVPPSLQRHMWREEEEKRNRTQQLFKKEKHRTSREKERNEMDI